MREGSPHASIKMIDFSTGTQPFSSFEIGIYGFKLLGWIWNELHISSAWVIDLRGDLPWQLLITLGGLM